MTQGHPLIIAHRGACGYVPEHTLAGYYLAIQQGADFIEPDLVVTRDGILVARHENAIASCHPDGSIKEATTDVADRPEFAARRTVRRIDGSEIEGWFTEDFTLAELKTLRCRERLPYLRPANARFDGQFEIPTLEEILDLLAAANAARAEAARRRGLPAPRDVGIYPETKHPSYFRGIGLAQEEALVEALHRRGHRGTDAPVFLQSFEVGNLKHLRSLTALPIIQLMENPGRPFDFTVANDPRTYDDLCSPAGLAEVACYATGIGVHKDRVVARDTEGRLAGETALVRDAHAAGLQVHVWTFRAENFFLPTDHRRGADDAARGDAAGEMARFIVAGIDGLFADQPDVALRALGRC